MNHVIKREHVRVQEEPAPHPAPALPRHRATHVELVRDEGRVVGIQVSCRCGEVIVVEVEYEEEAGS